MASRASLRPFLGPGPRRMLGTLSLPVAAAAATSRRHALLQQMSSSSMSKSSSSLLLKCWSCPQTLSSPQSARYLHSGTPPPFSPSSNDGKPSRLSNPDTGDAEATPEATGTTSPIAMPPPEGHQEQKTTVDSQSTSPAAEPEQTSATPPSPESSPNPDQQPTDDADPAQQKPPLTARLTTAIDNLQTRLLAGQQTLNDLTGYSSIDQIKHQNAVLEAELAAAQTHLKQARQAYKTAHSSRASTQREVTTLLARKDGWSSSDLERFTTLYRQDHQLESEAQRAARDLTEAEDDEARLSAALTAGIMRRYHEEQIWSDRIRRASTWGTWGLMGVNILLFLVLQFVAEPWRRRRLVRSIAEGEKPMMDEVRNELEAVREALAAFEKSTAASTGPVVVEDFEPRVEAVETTTSKIDLTPGVDYELKSSPRPPFVEVIFDPTLWGPTLSDLCSERRIELSMREASVIAINGAFAGALLFAGAFALLVQR